MSAPAVVRAAAPQASIRVCTRTVMDTIADPDITFDAAGVCNYWHDYQRIVALTLPASESERDDRLGKLLSRIRARSTGRYDSIIGLSGGVDSSYLALKAVELGLRPLAVHFDNGWNTELATHNIHSIVKTLGLDLETYVMDWEEFKDLQRAYFKASVVDLEIPTDHMIFGAIHRIANERGIRFFLNGTNTVSESVMPPSWAYRKQDLRNLRAVHRAFGTRPLKRLPALGVWEQGWNALLRGRESIQLLDLVDYNPLRAREELKDKVGWRDYGGKHHESIFTRFYQGYILPAKFGIDKRKAHLSNLICAGFVTRERSLEELKTAPYDPALQEEDRRYVAKKLGFGLDEFDAVLRQPNRRHEEFGTDDRDRERYFRLVRLFGPVVRALRFRRD